MSTSRPPSAVSVAECNAHIDDLDFVEPKPMIDDIAQDWVLARIPIQGTRLRPGGYVPGPALMGAVDLVSWLLVFSRNGVTPMALTWELKINFLRPAHGADVILEGRQTKFGKLCHASIDLYLDGDPDRLVAHATTTYVLPAK